MAIVCDRCKVSLVNVNGDICDECLRIEADSKIDKSFMEKIYLPTHLFEKLEKLHASVVAENRGSKKALSKFMSTLKTGFINKFTGKEFNDPTPRVIIPQEKTLDRIQSIINHNLAVYAAQNDMDTPEDLDDWTISDAMSDEWEESLYQYVESVQVMEPDKPTEASDSVPESADPEATPSEEPGE